MSYLLDFENQQKGYKPIYATQENFKANIGKKICYVDFIEPYRGTYFVRYGIITRAFRNRVILNDNREVDISKIKEAGIEI